VPSVNTLTAVVVSHFLREFPSNTNVSKITNVWYRLFSETRGLDFKYPKGFTMATLYMLHIERFLGKKPENEARKEGVSDKRRELLKRFGNWVPCTCDSQCEVRWNFGNDLGIHKDGDEQRCLLMQLFVELSSTNVSLDEQLEFWEGDDKKRSAMMKQFARVSFKRIPVDEAVEVWKRTKKDWKNSKA
jgi:hypothetical protein